MLGGLGLLRLSKYMLGAGVEVLASGRALETKENEVGAARRLWRLRGGPEPWLQVRGQSGQGRENA